MKRTRSIKRFKIVETSLALLFLPLFSGCEEILMVEDISGKQVQLTAPFDGAVFHSTSIHLSWEKVPEAESYRLQIARPDFDSPLEILVDEMLEGYSVIKQLQTGSYEWRVKAVNSAYETAYSKRSFIILSNEEFQNNTVVLTSPAGGLITNVSGQNCTWEPVLGAVEYDFQVLDGNNTVLFEETVTEPSFAYTFEDGSFLWRVRAGNGTQHTLFSQRTILVDTVPPNTPVPVSPANNATVEGEVVTFQWNRETLAGSEETDTLLIYSDSNLTNLVLETDAVSPFTTDLENGTYYWIVRARDAAGNESGDSAVFRVVVN